MRHILEALRLFGQHRRLRRYAWQPLLGALLLWIALFAAGLWWVEGEVAALIHARNRIADLLVGAGYAVVWYFVGTAVFLALAAILGSFAWDRLTGEVERLIAGEAAPEPSIALRTADAAVRIVFTLGMAVLGLCCNVVPVVGGVLVAGVVGLFDFTASAYLRRGVSLFGQFGRVFRLPGWFEFLVVSGVLSLVPVVNVLLLPVMAAAGAIMVIRGEPGRKL